MLHRISTTSFWAIFVKRRGHHSSLHNLSQEVTTLNQVTLDDIVNFVHSGAWSRDWTKWRGTYLVMVQVSAYCVAKSLAYLVPLHLNAKSAQRLTVCIRRIRPKCLHICIYFKLRFIILQYSDPVNSPSRGLEETTRTPQHHMAEHHTAGSEIPQSHTAWSNEYGPEPVSVDERVGVQVKLWNPLRTRAIRERFCGGDSLRRGAISSVCTFTFYL